VRRDCGLLDCAQGRKLRDIAVVTSLIHCFRYVEVDGLLVDQGYDLMVCGRMVESDAELIAWAERRERMLDEIS
jgi:TolB-like protein